MSELDPMLLRALAAGRAEAPASDRGRKRTLAALGLGSAALATPHDAPGSGARRFAGWSRLSIVLAVLAGVAVRAEPRATPPAEVTAPSVVVAAAPPIAPVVSAEAVVETLSVADLPNAPTAVTPERRAPPLPVVAAAPIEPAPSVDLLHEELAALARVSSALSERRCGTARRALSAYRVAYPAGQLAREADVLDIELLGRSGDVERARASATAFVAKFPDTPYALRLRPWLTAGGAGASPCVDDVP